MHTCKACLMLMACGMLLASTAAASEVIHKSAKECAQSLDQLRAVFDQAWNHIGKGQRPDLETAPALQQNHNLAAQFATAMLMEREGCARYQALLQHQARHAGNADALLPRYPVPQRLALAQATPAPVITTPGSQKKKKKKKKPSKKKTKAKGKKTPAPPPPPTPLELLKADIAAGDDPSDLIFDKLPNGPDRVSDIQEAASHLQQLHRRIAKLLSPDQQRPEIHNLPLAANPQFGPWWSLQPLKPHQNGGNILPPYQASGEQAWATVDQWQVWGPTAVATPAARSASLPPVTYLPKAIFPAQILPNMGKKKIANVRSWRPFPTTAGSGILRPPQWHQHSVSGYGRMPMGPGVACSWHGHTSIHCDKAGSYWFAAGMDDDGQLWINDELVAAWPHLATRKDLESPILFKYPLRQGSNRIDVRVRHLMTDRRHGVSGCWLRVCLAGSPEAKPIASTGTDAIPESTRGWRGNWQGVDATSTPPSAWNIEDGTNVRWRSALPWTISTPVISGDALITTAEPDFVVCLDKKTGKLRWKQRLDILELIAPAIAKEQRSGLEDYFTLDRELNKMVGAPDERTHINFKGQEMERGLAHAKRKELRKAYYGAIDAPLKEAGLVKSYLWMNYMGPVCATPVTDGTWVYAWSSMGAVGCFNLTTGERRWLQKLPHQGTAYGAFSSPLLVENKLILEVVPDDSIRLAGKSKGAERRHVHLLALDAESGTEVWRTPVHEPAASSSPIAMQLSNGTEQMTLIITAGSGTTDLLADGSLRGCVLGGSVVRLDDGVCLIKNLSVNCGYGTPVVVDDIVYHCGTGMMSATRLVMHSRDRVGAIRLWTQDSLEGMEPCVSPLGDHLYADLARGPGGQDDAGFKIFNKHNGQAVARHVNIGWPLTTLRSGWGGRGRQYMQTAIGGQYLYLGDSGEAFGGKKLPHATIAVFQASPQGRMLARNSLPPRSNASLVFDEDCIYYRNTFGVICLGLTGEKGIAYQAQQNARFLLQDIASQAPDSNSPTHKVAALASLPIPISSQSLWQRPAPPFLYSDATKPGILPNLAQSMTQGKLATTEESFTVTAGTKSLAMHLFAKDKRSMGSLTVRNGRVQGRCIAPSALVKKVDFSAATPAQYYSIFYYNPSDCFVRFNTYTQHAGIKAYLGEQELKDQDRYHLAAGYHVLTAEVICPNGDPVDPELCLDMHFTPAAPTAAEDRQRWAQDIRSLDSYWQAVLKHCPHSEEAQACQALLKQLP